MTNGAKIRQLDDTAFAEFILSLLKGEDEPEGYEYHCENCPASNCTNFEPEGGGIRMSKMKEVAALLGVEIGEEFGATGKDNTYKITDSEVFEKARSGKWVETSGYTLYELLTGKRKIIKKPWKPKNGEEFFVCLEKRVVADRWADCTADLMIYAAGNVFRTRAEAEAHSKEILKRLQKIYDDGKPLIGANE